MSWGFMEQKAVWAKNNQLESPYQPAQIKEIEEKADLWSRRQPDSLSPEIQRRALKLQNQKMLVQHQKETFNEFNFSCLNYIKEELDSRKEQDSSEDVLVHLPGRVKSGSIGSPQDQFFELDSKELRICLVRMADGVQETTEAS